MNTPKEEENWQSHAPLSATIAIPGRALQILKLKLASMPALPAPPVIQEQERREGDTVAAVSSVPAALEQAQPSRLFFDQVRVPWMWAGAAVFLALALGAAFVLFVVDRVPKKPAPDLSAAYAETASDCAARRRVPEHEANGWSVSVCANASGADKGARFLSACRGAAQDICWRTPAVALDAPSGIRGDCVNPLVVPDQAIVSKEGVLAGTVISCQTPDGNGAFLRLCPRDTIRLDAGACVDSGVLELKP